MSHSRYATYSPWTSYAIEMEWKWHPIDHLVPGCVPAQYFGVDFGLGLTFAYRVQRQTGDLPWAAVFFEEGFDHIPFYVTDPIELGRFASEYDAQVACERHAQRRSEKTLCAH